MKFEHMAYGLRSNFHTMSPDLLHLAHKVFGLVCTVYPLSLEGNESALGLAANVTSGIAGVPLDLAALVTPLVAHEIDLARARISAFDVPVSQLREQGRRDVGALQTALWFLVGLEPSDEEQMDDDLARKHAHKVELANKDVAAAEFIVRSFAESLDDKSLSGMQRAYYGITNSSWWLGQGPIALSVIGAVMKDEWDGIGEWRR